MTATLRAQLPLGPKGSLLPGRTTADYTAELRAERRVLPSAARGDGKTFCGRRSLHHIQGEQFALDLLGWSGALESRLVTFAEYRKEAA